MSLAIKASKRRTFGPLTWCAFLMLGATLVARWYWAWFPDWYRHQLNKVTVRTMIASEASALGSGRWDVREQAVEWLRQKAKDGTYRPWVKDEVRAALAGTPQARASACELVIVAYEDPEQAVDVLVGALNDRCDLARAAAARALGRARWHGPALPEGVYVLVIAALRPVVRDTSPEAREAACLALLEFYEDDPTVVDDVAALLDDVSSRYQAANALLTRGARHEAAMECLWGLATSEQPEVYRFGAVNDLYKHAPERRDALVDALARLIVVAPGRVRTEAVSALRFQAMHGGQVRMDLAPVRRTLPLMWLVVVFGTAEESLYALDAIDFSVRRFPRILNVLALRVLTSETLPVPLYRRAEERVERVFAPLRAKLATWPPW